MYYFKKLIDGNYSYYTSLKEPRNMDNMIVITKQEYENLITELIAALDANDSETPQEIQD